MDAQEQLPTHVPSVVEVVEDNILIEEVRSEELPTPSQKATSPAKVAASPSSPAKSLLHGFSSRQGTYKLGDKFIHLRDFRIVLKRLDKAFVYAALGKANGPKSKRRRTPRKSVTTSSQGTKGIKARPQRQTSNTEVSTGSNDVVSRGMAQRPRSFKQRKSTLEGSPRNIATQYPLVDAAKQAGTTGSPGVELIRNKSPGISCSTPNNRQDSINNRPSLDHNGASRLLQALGLKRRGVELEITPPQSQVELTPPNPATGIELLGMNKPNKPLSVPAVVNISGGRKRSNEFAAQKNLEVGSNKPVPQFTCYSCLNVFNNQSDFNSHRRQHVDDKCKCGDCGEDMETYWQLKRHVLEKIKAGKMHLKPPNYPPFANGSPPVVRRQVLKSPSNVLKPQNPPPPPPLKRRSVHTDSAWSGPSDMNSKQEHQTAFPMTSPEDVSDPLELYPPHFMQSFMEIDSPKKDGESQQNPKSTDPLATSASQSCPISLMTTQTGSKSSRLSGEILIVEERSGPFASDSPVREKPRVPTPVATYKLPSITSGPALPTISVTQSKSSLYGLPGSTSRATGRSLMTFSQTGKPLPSLNDVSIVSKPSVMVLGGDGEYSTYEELLEPLAKMKNFALAQKDGSILFTVHELEKHIMTTILSEGRDGGL